MQTDVINMQQVFESSLEEYKNFLVKNQRFLDRYDQFVPIREAMKNFCFDRIIAVETGSSYAISDGITGYLLAKMAKRTNGIMHSVDIDQEICARSKEVYDAAGFSSTVTITCQDSIEFLKNADFEPNIVLLDSWDVDLTNPFPSALHGWREFEAIENKMPVGSIIIIDDNWYSGTWVQWNWFSEGKVVESEIIDIKYPCVGKGAHIYQWLLAGDKNWKIVDAGYKIIIQKIRK